MAQLGYPSSGNTAPSSGSWTDSRASATQFWGSNGFTMPAGGGIVTDFYIYLAAQSGTIGIEGAIWLGNAPQWNGAATGIGTTLGWVHISVPNVYVAAGTVYLGFWSGAPVNALWEISPSGTDGGVQYQTASGVTTLSSSGAEYGVNNYGVFGCYIVYTPGGVAHVNTGTSGSPSWAVGVVSVNTGTPGSPVWTPARVRANTGTPASPNWVDGV